MAAQLRSFSPSQVDACQCVLPVCSDFVGLVVCWTVNDIAPIISYSTPLTFTVGTTIVPLSPTSSGQPAIIMFRVDLCLALSRRRCCHHLGSQPGSLFRSLCLLVSLDFVVDTACRLVSIVQWSNERNPKSVLLLSAFRANDRWRCLQLRLLVKRPTQ